MAAPGKRGLELSDEVPAKLSASTVADTKLGCFLQWCKKHDFNVSPNVCVDRERVCAQYGMVATEDIPSGEVLFCIPRPSLLSPETSTIAHILQQAKKEMGDDAGWVPLLLSLLFEYNNPKSPWRPYLDLVPDFSQLDLPMFWTSEERDTLLKGTGVEEAVTRDLTMMERDFKTKALPFMQQHPDTFSPACLSFELYKKMVAFIMAYSFTEPSGKVKGAEGYKEDDDSDAEEEESKLPPPMMVPLADILNHVAKNNAQLTFHKEALRMVTTRDIKKGEEVFNTYGELANKHLLHMYGFAERYPANHYDTVDIPVSVVTSVAQSEVGEPELMDAKLLFLQEQDLHQDGESYVLGVEGILTDDEMQAVLKVLVMSSEEFKEHADKEGWSDAESDENEDGSSPLSFENIPNLPPKWKRILLRCGEMCLSQIAGDEEKDEAAMESGNPQMSSRARYALYVRYGQRKLLHKLVDACR